MNHGITESLRVDTAQAPGTASTCSQLFPPKKGYTPEEKHGVLGRHTVSRQSLSTAQLVGMGAMGGLVGATLGHVVKSANNGSWTTVVAIGGIGAATFALATLASARPITPLEHAEAELLQTQDDKACLLKRDIDNPVRKYKANEIYTIKRLSERYGEPWHLFKLLWEVLFSQHFKADYEACRDAICSRLMELHVGQREIDYIVQQMTGFDSIEDARQLPSFKILTDHIYIAATTHDEIAQLMFAYSRLLLAHNKMPRGARPCELYQTLCLEKYESFKIRLAEDESRLIEDIRILRAIAEEEKDSVSISS